MGSGNTQLEAEPANAITRTAAGDIVRRAANRHPERTAFAVSETGESVTFREFDDRVNRSAHALGDALDGDDRLAFVAANSLQFLEAYFGALKAGITVVPINPEIHPEDIAYEFDHAEVDALLVEDTLYPKIESLLAEQDLSVLTTIDWGGEAGTVPAPAFDSFVSGYATSEPAVDIDAADLAQIMYTSGTTSKPKGVLLPHRALHAGAMNNVVGGNLDRDTVGSALLPMFHCAQLSATKGALQASAKTIIMRGFEPDRFLDDVETYGITHITMLPAMYTQLLARDDIGERDLSSLDRCTYAMAPIGNKTLEEAIETFDAEFVLGSGQTEAYPPTCFYPSEWQLDKQGNYWGYATPNTDIAIMDDEGNLLPDGEVGEIVYRGPNVMDGYLKSPQKTREAFEFGWFHSGDMGFFDEDGLLKFVDRKKDIIKSGGENVSTQKVEATLLDHPDIEELAVVGLPHDRWGEAVTVFAVPDGAADEDEVLAYAGERLAGFETPKAVEFVDELPKTATGKIQKYQVADQYEGFFH